MVRIEGDIVISRGVGEVFDVVADERNKPRFGLHRPVPGASDLGQPRAFPRSPR